MGAMRSKRGKMNYKIVASDIDGTLLNTDSQLSEKNISAISRLGKLGMHFVPATGRTLSEIPPEVLSCSDIRYIIQSNGAAVTDRISGEQIRLCIGCDAAKRLLDILFKYDAHLTVRHGGESYAGKLTDYVVKHNKVDKNHVAVIQRYANFPTNFKEVVYSLDYIEVVSAYFPSEDERQSCRAEIESLGECRTAQVGEHGLEIFDKSAGKGAALLALSEWLGVDRTESIGVGDSGNDITLVQAAGLGLAVKNATDELKGVADEVICSNDEGAIDYILKHFCES